MKNFFSTLFFFSSLILSVIPVYSQQQDVTGKQITQKFHHEILETYETNYLIYLPEDYEKTSEAWPLVLFLHGAGERGEDINYVKRNGPPRLVEEGKQFPFILISPQCPERTSWNNKLLINFLDEIESKYNVDKNRVYLTGLSMGGHATWSIAVQNPERFAAIIPVCGRWYSQDVYVLKDVPVWVFHGQKDDIVPITDGQKLVKALEEAGANVRFTIYPEAGHDAWTETYSNPEVYEWLLNHSLEDKE